jgi:hypothetical protein
MHTRSPPRQSLSTDSESRWVLISLGAPRLVRARVCVCTCVRAAQYLVCVGVWVDAVLLLASNQTERRGQERPPGHDRLLRHAPPRPHHPQGPHRPDHVRRLRENPLSLSLLPSRHLVTSPPPHLAGLTVPSMYARWMHAARGWHAAQTFSDSLLVSPCSLPSLALVLPTLETCAP